MWRTIATVAVAIGVTACGTGKQSASTPPATTTTIPASGGQHVVIAESGVSPRGQVRHQLAGRITDVERNKGEVTVRSADGSFNVKKPGSDEEDELVRLFRIVEPGRG